MTTNELYLKTIFCCMACDGEISPEETALVSKQAVEHPDFHQMNIEEMINGYVSSINTEGALFLKRFLQELESQQLTVDEELRIISYAVNTINADRRIEYSEVKFFKKIRNRLSLSDEQILEHQQVDIEDWLLPDIKVAEEPEWDNVTFELIKLATNESEQ